MVFMMHALLDSSAAYVINGPGKSLGFIAADAGYDVRPPQPCVQATPSRRAAQGLPQWLCTDGSTNLHQHNPL